MGKKNAPRQIAAAAPNLCWGWAYGSGEHRPSSVLCGDPQGGLGRVVELGKWGAGPAVHAPKAYIMRLCSREILPPSVQ